MKRRLLFRVALVLMLPTARASATYSIVGVDTATREVGGAGTSCLNGSDVAIIYGSVPGTGVVHAQATFSQTGRDRAVALLGEGAAPADILAEITGSAFDPNALVRQYAIADVTGRVVGYTGSGCGDFAGDRQGAVLGFGYSVQGNILTSEAVVTQAASAFEASGCDLADRLMHALEAGAAGGEGDSRCTSSEQIPSDSAFVQVDRPDEPAGSYLELHVPTSGNDNPLIELRSAFDQWRTAHPCPASAGAGGVGAAGAGASGMGASGAGAAGAGTAGAGAGGAGTAGVGTAGAGAGGAGTAGVGQGGAGASGSGATGGNGAHGSAVESAGCACRAPRPAPRHAGRELLLGVFTLILLAGRRWNRSGHRC